MAKSMPKGKKATVKPFSGKMKATNPPKTKQKAMLGQKVDKVGKVADTDRDGY